MSQTSTRIIFRSIKSILTTEISEKSTGITPTRKNSLEGFGASQRNNLSMESCHYGVTNGKPHLRIETDTSLWTINYRRDGHFRLLGRVNESATQKLIIWRPLADFREAKPISSKQRKWKANGFVLGWQNLRCPELGLQFLPLAYEGLESRDRSWFHRTLFEIIERRVAKKWGAMAGFQL